MPVSKCEKQDEEVWMHTANPKTLQAEIRKRKNTQRKLHRALRLLLISSKNMLRCGMRNAITIKQRLR
jgi:hypothetical protein